MDIPVVKNETYQVTIEDITYEGLGVGKVNHFPIFIENAWVGEKVEVKLVKVLKHFAYGKVINYLKESNDRRPLIDKRLFQTGIAPLQTLAYDQQLLFKEKQVKNVMKTIAKMPDVPVFPTLGMNEPTHYRNKAQVPVRQLNGKLMTGFFKKNSHELIPMKEYYIQDKQMDLALFKIVEILNRFKVKGYQEKEHRGFLRHIIIKRGHYSHEMMIVFVTRKEKFFVKEEIVQAITKEIPEVVAIIQNVNEKKTNVILGKENHVLFGKAYYEDQLLEHTYRISAPSFYQVNTLQAERLYQTAIDFAQLTKEDIVIDAYCGIGTIGISLAENVAHVYGVEVVSEAIEDAKINARMNNCHNMTFKAGKAEEIMDQWYKKGVRPTVVVVDPPRKGLDVSFIDATVAMSPERIIYVSCNPATMARDMKLFNEKGKYTVEKVQPVDLFPQTHHVEAVALLKKNKKDRNESTIK